MFRIRAALIAFFCLFSASAAGAGDMTYNAEITVDVTAENASVAREKAMTEANRQAYTAVAKRITTADGVRRLNELNDAQILNFIKKFRLFPKKPPTSATLPHLMLPSTNIFSKPTCRKTTFPLSSVPSPTF